MKLDYRKFLSKNQKPIKATRVFVATFYCHFCGYEFDNLPEKKEHQEICKTLGYSKIPRPKHLTKA